MNDMTKRPEADDDQFAGDPDACFSERTAAAFLGLSPRTLQAWRNRKTGPVFFKASGNRVRYRRRSLVAWIEARELGASSTPKLDQAS